MKKIFIFLIMLLSVSARAGDCTPRIVSENCVAMPLICIEDFDSERYITIQDHEYQIASRSLSLGKGIFTFLVHHRGIDFTNPGEGLDTEAEKEQLLSSLRSSLKRESRLMIDECSRRGMEQKDKLAVDNIYPEENSPLTTPERIIEEALIDEGMISDHVYDGARFQNWDYLRTLIYLASGKPLKPSSIMTWLYQLNQIYTHPRPTWKDKKGKTNYYNWCGVWATHILKRAGYHVYWELGSMKGNRKKVRPWDKDFSLESIEPGMVIVGQGPVWHHAIVLEVERDETGSPVNFVTMNGNHPGIGHGRMKSSDITAYIIPLP